MHTFMDNFHQGGKYSAQIANHQTELRREAKYTDQRPLYISYLQSYYLNLDRISGFGINGEESKTVQTMHFFWRC